MYYIVKEKEIYATYGQRQGLDSKSLCLLLALIKEIHSGPPFLCLNEWD